MKKLTKLSLILFTLQLLCTGLFAQDEQKAELVVQTGHTGDVSSVAISPDGKFLASGEVGTNTKLWNIANGQELRTFTGGGCVFSPDGKTLATLYGGVKLWNWQTGKELRTIQTETSLFTSVAFSPNGEVVASISSNPDTIKLWETATGRELRVMAGHTKTINSVTFSSDSKTLASNSSDNTIILWNWQTGEQLKSIQADTYSFSSVAFSPNGKTIAVNTLLNDIKLWDVETGKELKTLKFDNITLSSLKFSPDGNILASSGVRSDIGSGITLWNVQTGQELRTIQVNNPKDLNSGKIFWSIAFSPDGKTLAGGNDHKPRLWNTETGRELKTFVGSAMPITASGLSADGSVLASGNSNGTIKLWNLKQRQQVKILKGHNSAVEIIVFSEDGKTLASSDADKIIKLWDTTTGGELKSLLINNPETQKQVETVVPEFYRSKNSELNTVDGKFKIYQFGSGKIDIYSASDNKLMVSLISLDEHDWVVITPEGSFDASADARKEMHYVIGLETISLDQMKDLYYVPGLLQKIFKGEPLPNVELFSKKDLFPDVEFSTPKAGQNELNVKLKNRGGGIGQVQVLINGKEFVADARPVGFDSNKQETTLTVSLKDAPFVAGRENKIEVVARNAAGSLTNRGISRGAEIVYLAEDKSQIQTPNIYAIVGGISDYTGDGLDLSFASKDAEDFAKAFELGAARLLGDKSKVHIRILTSNTSNSNAKFDVPDAKISTATKKDFQKAFADFSVATPNDVFIVYLAGHGVSLNLNQNPNQAGGDTYLYLTQEATTTDKSVLSVKQSREAMSVSSEELKDLMKQNKALKQVLILDTCAAGALSNSLVGKRDLPSDQIRAIERLKDNTGFFVLMGSAANAVSYEASQYGQGLLTYSLLQGMKGAKLRENQFADVGLLFSYAQEIVPTMAKNIGGIQRPLIITPDTSASFDIGKFTETEQKKISLSNAKPIILRPSFINISENYDDLELTKTLQSKLREANFVTVRGESSSLIFVDADEMVDAVKPSGSYIVNGDKITVTIRLIRNKTPIKILTVEGNLSDREKLLDALVKQVTEAAKL